MSNPLNGGGIRRSDGIKVNMAAPRSYQISPWRRFPALVHGFGCRHLHEQDLRDFGAEKGFQCVFLRQIHGDVFHVVEKPPQKILRGDALITNRCGVLLVVKTADCLPIFLMDGARSVIAAVHCGWRGTLGRLASRVVRGMTERFGCAPASLQAALGPAIDVECYPVGPEVRGLFQSAGHPMDIFRRNPREPENWRLDLRAANRYQLLDAGLEEKRIYSVDRCTHCERDLYSFRRDGEKAGRLFNYIGLTCEEGGCR